MQMKVNKWGNSSAIRLPKQLAQQLNIKINDRLDCEVSGNKIILKKSSLSPDMTVQELFKDYHGEPVEVTPVIFESIGNEEW
ncbi:AbrB/MazE/SpoVT family DNA-binding domain-containing protein [Facklamia sp. DSM 111018]|uniref:AbrB/MazE/SpoVT family DNA-binding domain-containing protein n=1 Tax=Facklamia lactis TaxID=2749967 RepID=A0ABS0LSZ4_9LACT|nr:AbrB/MazE/SpoVT family DNA-binding domain-containing protein [Facklamia lactis]MBG9987275.1 AbrB/MazE/SpoVT family DNA-binding domain-containing protein [Facklamia lactis]